MRMCLHTVNLNYYNYYAVNAVCQHFHSFLCLPYDVIVIFIVIITKHGNEHCGPHGVTELNIPQNPNCSSQRSERAAN